jgi:hypothetical protein
MSTMIEKQARLAGRVPASLRTWVTIVHRRRLVCASSGTNTNDIFVARVAPGEETVEASWRSRHTPHRAVAHPSVDPCPLLDSRDGIRLCGAEVCGGIQVQGQGTTC